MLNKVKSIAGTVYNYTHIFVGAGAVVTSFLDTQALPPKFAAGVVIASQALKVANDWLVGAKTVAPIAEKIATAAVKQVQGASVLPPAAPVEPSKPVAAGPTITPIASGVVEPPTVPGDNTVVPPAAS